MADRRSSKRYTIFQSRCIDAVAVEQLKENMRASRRCSRRHTPLVSLDEARRSVSHAAPRKICGAAVGREDYAVRFVAYRTTVSSTYGPRQQAKQVASARNS